MTEVNVHTSMKVKLHTKKRYLTNAYSDDGKTSSELLLSANYANGKNAEWSPYTPALSFAVTVTNEVAEGFEVGDEFTLYLERDES